nr:MFS transporter [Sanguibacter sp. HDW7]
MTTRARTAVGGASGLLLVAIVLYALNLRGPIVAVAPVIRDLAADLGVTDGTAGLLSTIPVICFAAATPFVAAYLRRASLERAVLVSLALVLLGTVVRSSGGFPLAISGTIVIGVAITIGNVAVPVIVARDFPSRVGIITGIYTSALNLGSVITTVGTAPLAALVGWRWALVSWGLLVVVAGVVWRVATARIAAAPASSAERVATSREVAPADSIALLPPWKRWDVWLLVAAFGAQSFSYYGTSTWLPSILADTIGLSADGAGAAASVFQLMAIVGSLGAPALVARGLHLRTVSAMLVTCWLALPTGLLLAPHGYLVWMALAGVAQGGFFTMVVVMMVRRSGGTANMRRMSAFVQGLGYSLAAAGPVVLGLVHDASGSWVAPLLMVLAMVGVMAAAGLTVASAKPVPSQD